MERYTVRRDGLCWRPWDRLGRCFDGFPYASKAEALAAADRQNDSEWLYRECILDKQVARLERVRVVWFRGQQDAERFRVGAQLYWGDPPDILRHGALWRAHLDGTRDSDAVRQLAKRVNARLISMEGDGGRYVVIDLTAPCLGE